MRLPVLAKSIVDLFETLMNIHSLSHSSKSLRYVSRYLRAALDDGTWL
jgi:hypothetical protein